MLLGRSLSRWAGLVGYRGFTSIPIIDVAPLLQHSGATTSAKHETGRQLDDACREVGFFYVKNHGVSEAVQQGVLDQALRWFELPEEMKMQIQISPERNYRGYQQLGANVTRYDGSFQRDWHEAIDLYREVLAEEAQSMTASPVHGGNPWPSQIPQFEVVLRQYIRDCSALGAAIMHGLALGLGLPPHFFRDATAGGDPYWCVRVIHYPPLARGSAAGSDAAGTARRALQGGLELERSVQLSCGEHTDYGMLTLVNQQPGIDALQVRNAEGSWITATPVPGTFVCNIGDMMKVWTNGRYHPTMHRVINSDRRRSRVSIPYFYEPAFDTLVHPLPRFCQQRGPQYTAVRYGSHLEQKVLSNFEL